ncbi:MAG: alpha/beta hydrolase [Steroidobacter sp.]
MKFKLRLMIALLLLAGVAVSKIMQHQGDNHSQAKVQQDELVLGSLHLQPCEIGKRSGRSTVAAYCTTFSVAENRADPHGRHINLKIAVVRSEAATPDTDMVVFLDGGPGGSAINDYPGISDVFAGLRKRHHILLVDQRGTGGSNALDCPETQAFGKSLLDKVGGEQLEPARLQDMMRRCVKELDGKADTHFYTTTDAIADLEEIRTALNADVKASNGKQMPVRFDLLGVSYGTRVAQQYAMRYPDAVRSIVLDSPVPNTLVLGSEHAQSLEQALKQQLAACNVTPACKDKFGDAYANLHILHQRLQKKPVVVEVRDPNTFELAQKPLSAGAFAGLVRLYAYNPVTSALLPLMTNDALHGNYAPLLGQVQLITEGIGDAINTGMGLSVMCAEDADALRPDPKDDNTLLANSLIEFYQNACPAWPHGKAPADFHDAFKSKLPVLILSGEFDPVTPPRYAQEIAKGLSNARVLILHGQGHAVMNTRCVPGLIEKFVNKLQPQTLDATCIDSLQAIPMFIDYNGAGP